MTQPSSRAGTFGAILRVTSGNFLEQFDFFLFGFYATYIAKTFFPAESEFAGLMLTFAVFGSGFLMRPVGAIVLGAYIDRIGRRKGLMVTLAIMGCGTLLIALVPGYHSIGLLAPVLVLLGRLLQGFSAGVELGGVSVYLSEIATPGNKGFYTSWQSASQQVAIVVAALIGYGLNATLGHDQISEWGWRIPFFIGCMIIPLIFVLRRSLQETDAFLQRTHRPDTREIFTTIVKNWRLIAAGTLLVAMTTTTFYFITVYTPTFGRSVLKLSEVDSLLVTLCVAASNFFWLPIGGTLVLDPLTSVLLTVLFVVLTINAVNFVDGLDGLAVGVSTISSFTMLIIALVVSDGNVAIILAGLAGAILSQYLIARAWPVPETMYSIAIGISVVFAIYFTYYYFYFI